MGMRSARAELIVALDVDSRDRALWLRDELAGIVDFFKVGNELFTAAGPELVRELRDARVFLDLKFHDIPNTVARAVRAASGLGVRIVDVHAAGGRAMLEAASRAAREAPGPSHPLLFAVTVLTHLDDEDLDELGIAASSEQQVRRLARLAMECGLEGVVASAREVEAVREVTEGRLDVLVPGVRPAWAPAAQDQKRVATPAEAARAGARYVVVGRAITQQERPREAAARVREELEHA